MSREYAVVEILVGFITSVNLSMIRRQQFVYIVYLNTFTDTTDLMQPVAVCGACPLWTRDTAT